MHGHSLYADICASIGGGGAGLRGRAIRAGGNNAPAVPARGLAPGWGSPLIPGAAPLLSARSSLATPLPRAEMEFDSYQHYFYDHDAQEDFHRSTAPSEDIWKKFELVPTPPLSPLGTPGDKGCCSGGEERPGWLSRYCLAGEEPEYLIGTGQIFGNLSAFILKDCMWSGFSARERLEKAMTEKLSTGTQRASPHKPSFAQDFGFSSSVSECVDPAAVFLCPLAESKIPASSGSEGQSDSGKGRSRSAAELPGAPSLAGARRGEHACPHMCVQGSSQPGCAFVETPSEPRSRPHEQSGLGCSPFPLSLCSGSPCPSREGSWGSLWLLSGTLVTPFPRPGPTGTSWEG